MRTTLNISNKLLREAMKLIGSKTKTEVIAKALKELIRKYKLRAIKNYKGKVNLDVDLNVERDRSENFKR